MYDDLSEAPGWARKSPGNGVTNQGATVVSMAINAWNIVKVAFKTEPGSSERAYGLDKARLR